MTNRKPATRKPRTAKAETPEQPVAELKPGRVTASRDELIARKRLAGAGRREDPGTAFGSRWTQGERDELQALLDEHGREKAIADFVAAHPHRTTNGAAYQVDKNLTKRS